VSSDGLTQTDDLTAATWIAPRLGAFGSGVRGVIPAGFEAYARILHPARSCADDHVRWDTVAAAYGKVAHPLMQFHTLVGASSTTNDIKTGPWQGSPPSEGDLEPESLAALLDVLARHADAPQECWFAVWEGWGWMTGAVWTFFAYADDDPAAAAAMSDPAPEAQPAPFVAEPAIADSLPPDHRARVALPGRNYVLFGGPLEAALEVGYWPTPNWFLPQSPSIFWPDNVSWCVATEIDLFCTYVGGPRALIDDLLADQRLEVWEAHLDDPVAHDSDVVNR
jgi:hypothetical protein